MIAAAFLPLLYWTGTVIAVTLFGYPGVVCMTPVAWLLALPVGFRLARESRSAQPLLLAESLLTGGVLGFWQGLLFAAAMAMTPYVTTYGDDLPSAWLTALAGVLISAPVMAALTALAAWFWRIKNIRGS